MRMPSPLPASVDAMFPLEAGLLMGKMTLLVNSYTQICDLLEGALGRTGFARLARHRPPCNQAQTRARTPASLLLDLGVHEPSQRQIWPGERPNISMVYTIFLSLGESF